ncbi:phosphomannose isomerase type II C-terminal cupin domain [Synechococcus sp. H55.2]|uniref:phosphomannose isomerase type II C-terminal cupin domain n=1 Tax=unclassified Synechococcus TaxID=2626047 RepID=UPI0039C35891
MLETPNANPASLEKPSPFLSAETLNKLIESNTETRPWGSFTVLEEGPGYKIKRIVVLPKHRLSLQMHYHRSEHWIVVAGTAKVTCGDEERLITTNQSTYVPPCTKHRLENPGVIPLVIIEVQNGQYLGEDDIIRFSDDYARANGGQPAKA